MVRKLSIVVVAVAAIVGSTFAPARAETKTVEIPDRFFRPAQLTIVVGDTVRWTNTDDQRHSVSANTSAQAQGEFFDSGTRCPGNLLGNNCLRPGESFSHTFSSVGTFTYRCRIHGSNTSFSACAMCGQIIVRAAAPPPPPPSTPAKPTVSKTPTATTSPSASMSATATATGSSPVASGPPADDGSLPVLPIAAGAVVLLAGSGILVYRSMLKN